MKSQTWRSWGRERSEKRSVNGGGGGGGGGGGC